MRRVAGVVVFIAVHLLAGWAAWRLIEELTK